MRAESSCLFHTPCSISHFLFLFCFFVLVMKSHLQIHAYAFMSRPHKGNQVFCHAHQLFNKMPDKNHYLESCMSYACECPLHLLIAKLGASRKFYVSVAYSCCCFIAIDRYMRPYEVFKMIFTSEIKWPFSWFDRQTWWVYGPFEECLFFNKDSPTFRMILCFDIARLVVIHLFLSSVYVNCVDSVLWARLLSWNVGACPYNLAFIVLDKIAELTKSFLKVLPPSWFLLRLWLISPSK